MIRPNLWFDTQAEEAARFYVDVFKDGKLGTITHYPGVGQEITGKAPGSVLTVEFEVHGQPMLAMNGGPEFKFNESISLEVDCKDQAEVDYYWENLTAGGDPAAQQCGWLKDRYGVSWQIVPVGMTELLFSSDQAKSDRAFQAMMSMHKLDIAEIRRAFEDG